MFKNPFKSREVKTRRKSFTLMKVFYQMGAYNSELFETPYENAVRRGITEDPMDVQRIKDYLASKDEQEALIYLQEHPELKSAIEDFTASVAEKQSNPPYLSYWSTLSKIAETVNRYTGKNDKDESGRMSYYVWFPRTIKETRDMWEKVPPEIQSDMIELLKVAYSEDREFLCGVLEVL